MGVKVTSVRIATCDLCGQPCDEYENRIDHVVKLGYGGVGPTRIRGTISLYAPYCCDQGLLCRPCLIKSLESFLESEK